MRALRYISLVACAALVALPGCSSGPPVFDKLPVRVVVTTTMIADMVKRVGGDRVAVEWLMGPGVDPHRYQPTAGDTKKIEAAHLVFFNGLHLEGKMTDTFAKSRDRIRGYAVTDAIDKSLLLKADVDGGDHDPHVWFDVQLWSKCVPTVKDAFVKLDPAGKDIYEKNAAAYIAELDALDKEIRAELNKVPEGKRRAGHLARCLQLLRQGLRLRGGRSAGRQHCGRSGNRRSEEIGGLPRWEKDRCGVYGNVGGRSRIEDGTRHLPARPQAHSRTRRG